MKAWLFYCQTTQPPNNFYPSLTSPPPHSSERENPTRERRSNGTPSRIRLTLAWQVAEPLVLNRPIIHLQMQRKELMKKNLFVLKSLLLAVFLLVLSSCGTVTTPTQDSSTPETMNASLETLAKLFAKAVTDASVRQQIQGEVAKRFDGDTNVLYQTLTAISELQTQSGGTNIKQSLTALQSGGSSLEQLVRSIPRLQVAMPAGFDAWDASSEVPLVGFVPVDADDKTIREIKVFDAEGNMQLLDARALPSKPVILLSQNERTDETGQVLSDFSSQSNGSASVLTPQWCAKNVYMEWLYLRDDNEPWYKGSPEIMLIATSRNRDLSYHAGFTDADSEGKWYNYHRFLGCTSADVVYYWYEDDGGGLDITPSYGGFSLNIKIDDDDDFMGAVQVPYSLLDSFITRWDLGDVIFYSN